LGDFAKPILIRHGKTGGGYVVCPEGSFKVFEVRRQSSNATATLSLRRTLDTPFVPGAENSERCDDTDWKAVRDKRSLCTSTRCAVGNKGKSEYSVSQGRQTLDTGRDVDSRDVHATVISHTRNSARARSPRSGNVASAENGAAPSAPKRKRSRSTSSPRYLELSAIALTSRE
jgi:hypothetical protein